MSLEEKIREKAYSQQEVEEIGKQETHKAINKHDGSLMRLAKRHVEEQIWVKLDDALKILAEEMQFLNEEGILEYLASLVHKQWSHWINYQDSEREIPPFRSNEMERWLVQARTPYSKLTEEEKESDREWARKVLAILKMQLVFEKERWKSEQEHKKLRDNKK